MISFVAYDNGKPIEAVSLSGAYVFGSDDIPLRAELKSADGVISCSKRAAGPAGLALCWPVKDFGTLLLETVRVQERKEPYILQIELARGRLVRINQKMEDWGLLDFEGTEEIAEQVQEARELLIEALQADDPAEAAALGDESLSVAVHVSEALGKFHAEMFLARRKQSGGFQRHVFGCSVDLEAPSEEMRQWMDKAFDFVTVPFTWREIEPTEQTFNWRPLDAWIELLAKHRVRMKGTPLLSFRQNHVPDWLYTWEHDFNAIRDLAFEHIRRVVNRYGQHIQMWDVVSGLHATNCFTFNFEQLMELTRMAAALTSQIAPRSLTIVDIVSPWGEYYARNQRTIPPLLYAEMIVQSGIEFDAFGLQFKFGPGVDGMFVRDMFQISSLLDQFVKLNKPVHVTATQVPSTCVPTGSASGSDNRLTNDGGSWRGSWSEKLQSEWLDEFLETALSKPNVVTVSWHYLADSPNQVMNGGGLLRSDMAPKEAYNQLLRVRADLLGGSKRGNKTPST